MSKANRIDKSLLDDSLIAELASKLDVNSVIDWSKVTNKPQLSDSHWKAPVNSSADLPLVGNLDSDVRLCVTDGSVYRWDGITYNQWILVGANDSHISWVTLEDKPLTFPPNAHTHLWNDLTDKPTTFVPSAHTHTESEISNLDKYTKSETDTKLAGKANSTHTHATSDVTNLDTALAGKVDKVTGMGLSSNDYTSDDKNKLASLSNSATVDYSTMNQNLTDHENNATVHVTQTDHDAIATVGGKADKTYVDTQLANKADSSTLSGHTGNSTIHVTQIDKDTWNGKANVSQIPTKTSQISNDSGFTGDEITIGATQPTTNLWYKVVG